MSDATQFLAGWIEKAAHRAPSITRVTAQSWTGVGTPPNFKPGIASYGWGINGTVLKDSTGNTNGLRFSTIWVWFSDRGQDVSKAPPACGQQFTSNQDDIEGMSFTLDGDQVLLAVVLWTWKTQYSVATTNFDAASQQLIFGVPGAGPNAPRALLTVSFADTGQFNWLD